MNIGKLIKERRKFLGLTLEQVGDAVGVKKSTVMKWESGKIQNMRRDRIKRLSDILGIDPILLINDETLSMKNKEPAHPGDGRELVETSATEAHLHVFRSLLHYHDQMMVSEKMFRKAEGSAPTGIPDAYREALVAAIELFTKKAIKEGTIL